MSALDTLRTALWGSPPSATHEPSREGVFAAFTEVYNMISGLTVGWTAYETKALLDADVDEPDGTLGYVWNNNGVADDPLNGVYQSDGGVWEVAEWYAQMISTVVQPLVDEAQAILDEVNDKAGGIIFSSDGTILVDGVPALGGISIPDAEGIVRLFMAFMPNGAIVSSAIDALIGDQLGDFTFSTDTDIAGYLFTVTQEGPDGRIYVICGRKTDGTWEPSASNGSGGRTCYHVLILGQSNGSGDGSIPVITASSTGYGNVKFSRGLNTRDPVYAADPENRPDNGFTLVNLTESAIESRATGVADTLKMLFMGRSRFMPPTDDGDYVLVTNTSLGSRRLADVGPLNDQGEGNYITAIDDIARAKAAVEAAGDTYVLLGLIYDGNEKQADLKLTDGGSTLSISAFVSGYRDQAISLAETFDSDARAITGQSEPVPTFVTPASSHVYTAEAWIQAADMSDLIRLVGGRGVFQSALIGNLGAEEQYIHYSPDSHRTDIGERCAHAIFETCFQGRNFNPPVMTRAVKESATTVRFYFDTNWPLTEDYDTIPPAVDYGFTLYGGTLDAPTGAERATAIEISDDGRSVLGTFASVPASARVSCCLNSICAITVANVTSVAAASNDPADGATRFAVQVVGDLEDQLAPLIALGHFKLYGSGAVTSEGVIREVTFGGGNTTFIGRVDERRSDGSYVAFQAGQTLLVGHTSGYGNVRDTNPSMARTAYQHGARVGVYPHLGNWMIGRNGVLVEGAQQ